MIVDHVRGIRRGLVHAPRRRATEQVAEHLRDPRQILCQAIAQRRERPELAHPQLTQRRRTVDPESARLVWLRGNRRLHHH
jgi:hypothetical protein